MRNKHGSDNKEQTSVMLFIKTVTHPLDERTLAISCSGCPERPRRPKVISSCSVRACLTCCLFKDLPCTFETWAL